jgi:replicative DNA helicase
LLSDLRESGAIEQDADIVAFLYRPEYYGIEIDQDDDWVGTGCNSELIISKFRQGGTGTVLLYWKGDKTRFYNKEYSEQDAAPIPAGTTAAAFGSPQQKDDESNGLAF